MYYWDIDSMFKNVWFDCKQINIHIYQINTITMICLHVPLRSLMHEVASLFYSNYFLFQLLSSGPASGILGYLRQSFV